MDEKLYDEAREGFLNGEHSKRMNRWEMRDENVGEGEGER